MTLKKSGFPEAKDILLILPNLLLAFRIVIPSLAVKVTSAGGKNEKNGREETALN